MQNAGVLALTLLRAAYSLIAFLTLHFVKSRTPLARYQRPGPQPTYALVTGASAGIGLGIAAALARDVHTLVLNAQTANGADIAAAVAEIADLPLGVLVNNVGGNPVSQAHGPPFRPLSEYSADDVDAVVDMNARFMARLSALVVPLLARDRAQGARSLILSTSSGAFEGMPMLVMYSATKAFNLALSMALGWELAMLPETANIDTLAIVPGDVRSEGNSEVPEGTIKCDVYGQLVVDGVDAALRQKRSWSPYWLHDLQLRLLAIMPDGIKTTAVTDIMKQKSAAFNAVWERNQKKR